MAVKVGNGKNDDRLGFDSVKQAVREPMYQPSPDVLAHDRPAFRMLCNIARRRFDFIKKSVTQACYLQLIVVGCIEHFLFGRLQEADRRHLICALASRIASAAGFVETRPFRYS